MQKYIFFKSGFNLSLLKPSPQHSWISKDGKDCPESSSPAESHILGHGEGGQGGQQGYKF